MVESILDNDKRTASTVDAGAVVESIPDEDKKHAPWTVSTVDVGALVESIPDEDKEAAHSIGVAGRVSPDLNVDKEAALSITVAGHVSPDLNVDEKTAPSVLFLLLSLLEPVLLKQVVQVFHFHMLGFLHREYSS